MTHAPLHLTDSDFDAYAPEKATSNAYSRPRLEVKQRALAWARGVFARLAELGITVDMHGSDEHPTLRNKKRVDCQWVFFWRDAAAREELERLLDAGRSISAAIDDPSPYGRHAFLALRIDSHGVEVCFAVHPEAKVDIDNLRARLAAKDAAEGAGFGVQDAAGDPKPQASNGPTGLAAELTAALRALPEQFAVGVGADRVAASAATPEAIEAMLERAAEGQVPLWIGWAVPREVALEHAEILDEQLEDALLALAPIYTLVAWSRQNDHIALDRRLEGIERERARTHAEVSAQTEKWQAEQAAARERSLAEAKARGEAEGPRASALPFGHGARPGHGAPRRPSLDTLFKPGSKAEGDRDRRGGRPQEAKAPQAPAAPREREREHTPAPPRVAPSPAPAAAAPAPAASSSASPAAPTTMEKGARVRVLSGAFADKIGVLGELDGRGGARVLLGLLSTRIDVTDLALVPEGRERPAIQSSHRRPTAPMPRKAR
ncbi:hypothetical protein [Polyangium jinanense]|uniref:KOW domain-containing protein n=1 Tax=Polyangium jinanense TaxID=2829994 RepID=A0A9X4ASJ8_9BACT|nr:hypothetical protein [Polyangium jinanense]MDC3954968.1 hypothetical protein [Polyangium jinanense]MDC3981262.1 hypothetical protein [Polyangium jinanense]